MSARTMTPLNLPTAPAWDALLRAELARIGTPPDAVADAAAQLAIAGPPVGATQHLTHPPHPALSAQRSLRWSDRTLALGSRTLIMGVVNVTDDSFSGDGLGGDLGAIVARAEALVAAGADVLDVGGESTRPGATDVGTRRSRCWPRPSRHRI